MATVKNARDHEVEFNPFEIDGNRLYELPLVQVGAGETVEVSDECAHGAPKFGRGGLLDQEENWALVADAPKPKRGEKTDGEDA